MAYSPVAAGNSLWSVGVWAPKESPRLLLQSAYHRQMLLVALAVLSVIGGTFYAVVQSDRSNRRLQTDIAERRRIEGALRRSKEFFKTTLDSMNDAVSIINVKDFTVAGVNRVFLERYGLREEEVTGKTCYETTHRRLDPCCPPDDTCPLTETLRTGEHAVAEHVHYLSNGEKVFVEVSTSPIREDDGEIAQVVHVARDITKRKKAEEDLRKYAGKLEEANRLKDLFTDIISHDLLNPVSVIMRFSEMLGSGRREETEMRDIIQRNAGKIEDMIKSISNYVRVESVEEIEKTDRDLVGVLTPIIERFKPEAADKGMTIEFDPQGKAMLTANPILEDVFSNILSNAIKYSPRNTTVSVIILEEQEDWIVSFADEGGGIPDAFKNTIFDRFERIEKEGVKGTGLGLVRYGSRTTPRADAHSAFACQSTRISRRAAWAARRVVIRWFLPTRPFSISSTCLQWLCVGNKCEAIHREGTTAPTMWCHFGQYREHRSLGLPFEGDSGCGKDSKYQKTEKSDRSKMAGRTGLEPAPSGLTGQRYNHLNYRPASKNDLSGGRYKARTCDFLRVRQTLSQLS